MYKTEENNNNYLNNLNLKGKICSDFSLSNTPSNDRMNITDNKMYNSDKEKNLNDKGSFKLNNCYEGDINSRTSSNINCNNVVSSNNNSTNGDNNLDTLQMLDSLNYWYGSSFSKENILKKNKNSLSGDKKGMSQSDYLNIKKSKLINYLNFFMRVCCSKSSYIKFVNHYFNIIYSNNINILFKYECILQKFGEYNEKNLTAQDYYNGYVNLNKVPLFLSERHSSLYGKLSDINSKQEHLRSSTNFEKNILSFLSAYDNLTINFFNHIFSKLNNGEMNMDNSNVEGMINNFLYKKKLLKENVFNLLLKLSKSYEIKYSEVINDIQNGEHIKEKNEERILELLNHKEVIKLSNDSTMDKDHVDIKDVNNEKKLDSSNEPVQSIASNNIYDDNKNDDNKNDDNENDDNKNDDNNKNNNNDNKNDDNKNDDNNNNSSVAGCHVDSLNEPKMSSDNLKDTCNIHDTNEIPEVDKEKDSDGIYNLCHINDNNINNSSFHHMESNNNDNNEITTTSATTVTTITTATTATTMTPNAMICSNSELNNSCNNMKSSEVSILEDIKDKLNEEINMYDSIYNVQIVEDCDYMNVPNIEEEQKDIYNDNIYNIENMNNMYNDYNDNNNNNNNIIENMYSFLKNNNFIPNDNIYTDFFENGNDVFLNKIKKNDKDAYFKLIEKFDRMYSIINDFKSNIKPYSSNESDMNNMHEYIQKKKKKKIFNNNDYIFKMGPSEMSKKNLRNNSLTKNEGLKRSKRNLKKNDIAKKKAK
ncbi:conserved Plasmodium protein, unknown function [Plasmodium reichenowi]|uniref:Uncharacterized protein n=1 Tax=Plasmodium reichenowi TaxID=5854 RepID=A0A2P9D4Z7_PLARE|nr:conserved Plasmodium protein, unknown function [Plasmodium reichenowi]